MVCFLFFCDFAPPPPPAALYYGSPPPGIYESSPFPSYNAPVVSDGMGGLVPFTNSRVLPDGSLRPYDPVIDGPAPPIYP